MPIDYRGVVFDLFHTLTAGESHSSSLPGTSSTLGADPDDWNRILFDGSRWRLAGEEKDPKRIITALAHAVDPSITEDRIARAVEVRTQRFHDTLSWIPEENLATVDRLREAGLRVGLVSNADSMEARAWRSSPLSWRLDAAVFSCDVGHVKPEPEIYRICLERLGVSAKDCLYVGDGGSRELEGAKNVGMTTVLMSGIIAELWPDVVVGGRKAADHEIGAIPEVCRLAGLPE